MSEHGVYTTGPTVCGTVANGGAGTDWVASGASLQADCATSDDTRATATLAALTNSKQLNGTNCGLTVPGRAQPRGIVVSAECSASLADSIYESNVLVIGAGVGSDNKAIVLPPNYWPTTDAVRSWGATNDLWGLTGELTIAEVNATTFGPRIVAAADLAAVARIDLLTIEVFYHLPQVVSVHRAQWPNRDGLLHRVEVAFRTDGDGGAEIEFGPTLDALPAGARLDSLICIADATDAPSALWDMTMPRWPGGPDMLAGACLDLAANVSARYYPFRASSGSLPGPVLIDGARATLLEIDNAGVDKAGTIVLYLQE